MFFWFKKKKIVLDCFTADSLTYDRHKPERAVHSFPEWWVQTNPADGFNMRNCVGFKEFFRNAVSINMWCPFHVEVDTKNKAWEWKAPGMEVLVDSHAPEQYNYFLDPNNYRNLKIQCPWSIKTNRYVQFAFIDSFWCRNTYDYLFPNAIIDFFYQHTVEINMFFRMFGEKYTFSLLTGKPLVFLIPLTEEKIEIKTHLVSKQEMRRFTQLDDFGPTRYFSRKKHTDKLLAQQKKCPFGFGE